MKYFFPDKKSSPYELFQGERYGKANFAAWSLDKSNILKLLDALNNSKHNSFSANVTGATLKHLKELFPNLQFEQQKLFPDGLATVPDMFTVTL